MFIYFVSFGYMEAGQLRLGNLTTQRTRMIGATMEDVARIQSEIADLYEVSQPVIISYQLLRTEPMGSTATAGQLSQEES